MLTLIKATLDGFFPYWRIVGIALVALAGFWGGYNVASNAAAANAYDSLVKSVQLQAEASNRNLARAAKYEETIAKLLTDKTKIERKLRNELENPVYNSCANTTAGLQFLDDLGRSARAASKPLKSPR